MAKFMWYNTNMNNTNSRELAKKLLEIKAVKLNAENPFTWTSGTISPIYCDNRVLLSYPEKRDIIKNGLVKISAYFDDFDEYLTH